MLFAYAKMRGNHVADQRLCFHNIESTITLLHQSEISSPKPSYMAVQPSLCLTWAETQKTSFLMMRLISLSTLAE